MKIFQQHLLVIVDEHCQSINAEAQKMLKGIVADIKGNKSTRRNGDLIHEIKPTPFHLPKSVNVEKCKTKWQIFAESKGINNRKKSRMVYSEEMKQWLPRFGSRSIQNMKLQGGVVEVEQSISKLKKEKELRVKKNLKNREKNRKKLELA